MRQRDRQSGFSVKETLFVVVAVGVIGMVGWFVYQHNRVKLTNAAPNSNVASNQQITTPQPTLTTPAMNQNVVKIPELGIQITVPDSIKDLKYKTVTVTLRNKNQATIAYFSTTALAAADANCGTNFGPLGTLEKANGQYPTQSEDETNVLDYGQLVKQFPTFYITVGYSQAACSTAATAGSATAATRTEAAASRGKGAFSAALSTIQPLN